MYTYHILKQLSECRIPILYPLNTVNQFEQRIQSPKNQSKHFHAPFVRVDQIEEPMVG